LLVLVSLLDAIVVNMDLMNVANHKEKNVE